MITALISAGLGLVSGVVPDIVKEIRDGRDAKRERQFLELQHTFQMQRMQYEAGTKLEVAASNEAVEEMRAFASSIREIVQAQSRPTGIAWIDGFNALLRPLSVVVIIGLFAFVALGFSDLIPADVFAPLYLQATEAVLGFLFGYRAGRKTPVVG